VDLFRSEHGVIPTFPVPMAERVFRFQPEQWKKLPQRGRLEP
jgi:hypothetical protein